MSICTKTGDNGETGLYTGERVAKCSLRVKTYGALDEAGSALGLARAFCTKDGVKNKIFALQKIMPSLMADLASNNRPALITAEHIAKIEQEIDELEKNLPPLTNFVIPGSTKGGAFLDLARTVLRRAECLSVELSRAEKVHGTDCVFLNRLSDYCFLLMRREEE